MPFQQFWSLNPDRPTRSLNSDHSVHFCTLVIIWDPPPLLILPNLQIHASTNMSDDWWWLLSGNPRRTARRRPATAATQFKISISALINNLSSKSLHFIRCIKSNDMKQSKLFNLPLVQHQLEYQGFVPFFHSQTNALTTRAANIKAMIWDIRGCRL